MKTRNRAMIIGSIGAGKSTLTHALVGRRQEAVKTQSLRYEDWIVDTPGEYIENPMYYRSLMATSLEVTHVLYIQDATRTKSSFPPGFSTGIPKLPIAVVTKADAKEAHIERAIEEVKKTVPRGPVVVSSVFRDQGIEEIRQLVLQNTLEEMKEYIDSKKSNFLFFL
ncbi:EutP/PduV family microcompartment system protein [Caldalkalibacillus mannanilyticus]|uniref:EutP/PduV family microcompartment system protein n=1 Tax=Caldalkalibacillus mannanilyticus TaxID=1418 RepID=UPI000468169F|nr:EutP/PduV family microcompartment system protein [Caldalkalibacillus mannanilyticus]